MPTNKSCLIVSAGKFENIDIDSSKYDLIFACDKGYMYCQELGITPNLILGDFDSADYPNIGIPFVKFRKEKDDTDTLLTIKHAIHMGCNEITVICGLGNRLDHTYANIQSAAYAAQLGVKTTLLGIDTVITVFSNTSCLFSQKNGWSLSVFCLSDICSETFIHGTKYELDNYLLTSSFPIGQSNEIVCDVASVGCSVGTIMVIESVILKST